MLKRFVGYYRPHWKLFALDMIVAFLSAGLSILFPMFTRQLLKTHIPSRDMQAIIMVLLFMLGIIVFKTVFTFIRIKWGHILGVRMEYDMRADLFRHIQKLSFTYFDNVKTGHIMSRISNDLNMIAEVAHHAPEDSVISLFMIVGAFGFMFSFNPLLALIALCPLPIMIFWGLKVGGQMREGFRGVRRKIADINSSVENSVQGIREVKAYTNEKLELEKFNLANFNFRMAKEIMYNRMAVFHSGMMFLTDFYHLTIIGGGGILIFLGKVEMVDLIAFSLYVSFMMQPIQRLVNFVEQLQQGAAAFERFIEIMDVEPEIKDKKNAQTLGSVKGEITIDNLSFRYQMSPDLVLKNINLSIPAGKKIALVGESGAGKSTIVSLIPRFYEAQQGSISIDGNNILQLKQRFLRQNIGIVQQNVFLFDGTIRENIMYGNPCATEEELIAASQKANIYDFIMTLPQTFDTEVGERGVKLSGGQKQRISIARVFLKNPPILIFDEATSSLDTESESLIQQAMDELSKNRTTITIAHRLSTVINSDLIYVLQKGEVVEEGTHDDLLARNGVYYQLHNQHKL